METAKIFENGKSQAVRLPKKFRFADADEVYVTKLGNAVMLFPKDEEARWESFLEGINGFSDDVFANGRETEMDSKRNDVL